MNIFLLFNFSSATCAFQIQPSAFNLNFRSNNNPFLSTVPRVFVPTIVVLNIANNEAEVNDQDDCDEKESEVITLNNDGELLGEYDDENEEDQDWISDRDLVRRAAVTPGGEFLTNRNKDTLQKIQSAEVPPDPDLVLVEKNEGVGEGGTKLQIVERSNANIDSDPQNESKPSASKMDVVPKKSVYTDEEEELIGAMGGKHSASSSEDNAKSTREPGYLGDSTLSDIAMDFSVPICYIADVLVTWGSPIPIDPHSNLGDLVTGEQAFALLEAIHTLDISALQDRYSDDDIITVAEEYDIPLKEAFDFAVKEGWSLPFGVRTHLRVEQEDAMIRALADDLIIGD